MVIGAALPRNTPRRLVLPPLADASRKVRKTTRRVAVDFCRRYNAQRRKPRARTDGEFHGLHACHLATAICIELRLTAARNSQMRETILRES